MSFASFLDALAPAAALLAPDGTVREANAQFLAILGLSRDETVGQPRSSLHAMNSRDAFRSQWQDVSLGRSIRSLLPHVGGSDQVWLQSLFTPITDPDGKVAGVLEFADRADERLQGVGVDRALTDMCAVAHFSPSGAVGWINEEYRNLFGLQSMAGSELSVAETFEGPDESSMAVWSEILDGSFKTSELRRRRADRSPIWVRSSFCVIISPDGAPIKVIEYAVDFTERRIREAALQGQADAVSRSHCVITFAMDGTITMANENFLSAMGYDLEGIVGRHHRMFVDPAYAHGPEYAKFWKSLERGEFQAGEYKQISKTGKEVWLQATYSPIFDPDGRPSTVVEYATVVTDERLRQSEHQGQIAAIHKSQAVISFDLEGRIIDANDRFLEIMGYRLSEVRGQPHRIFVDVETAASEEYLEFWRQLGRGQFQSGEFRRVTKDGRDVWLHATYNPIFDMSGRPFRVVKYASDITSEKTRQANYQGQIEAINRSQAVVAFTLDGEVIEANANFLALFGYTNEEVVGQHHAIFVDTDHLKSDEYRAFWSTLRSGSYFSGMFKRVAKDGSAVWIRATYNPILDLKGNPSRVIKFATDVTADVELAEAYQDAKRQAQHDSATSLPNRVRLSSFLTVALMAPDARVGVLYLDLDRFKPINDTYGHAVGDRVLGEVADRLRRTLRGDQLAARVGGDEFIVAAPDLMDDQLEALCQTLIAAVCEPIQIDQGYIQVGVSIGVAVSPVDGRTPDELIRCADAALYRSKETGGSNYSFHSSEMNERLEAYRMLVEDMRTALCDGEFVLEYQPRFDAVSRKVNSVEALVRWDHPHRGRIPPVDFISVAEKSGLIVPLGEWVLRTACERAIEWPSIGISVNISPVQFRSGNLTELVIDVLNATGLDPARLELELTEGILVEDADRARACLTELKAVGVKLAIDDFGTGYSSLSYLRTFPFDVIKIDRQFIADIDNSGGGRAIVQAILGLGKALGLSVTAEGVETDEQLMMLRLDACEEVQGYLLARPLAPDRVSELLTIPPVASPPTAPDDRPAFSLAG